MTKAFIDGEVVTSYKPVEIAEMYNVGKQTVWRWIREGDLKAWKTPAGRYFVSESALEEFLQSR